MFVLSPALRDILRTPMARYSLFVLTVTGHLLSTIPVVKCFRAEICRSNVDQIGFGVNTG